MLVRSRWSRPPSKRSGSSRVSRSPRNPAYTVAATIAPMIPPHRAAATSTPPPRIARSAAAVYRNRLRRGPRHEAPGPPALRGPRHEAPGPPSAGQGGLVDLGDLGGHHRPGVAAGVGGRRLA